MFDEQLHESFDKISPSPELLDRISAMMQEEVSRKKPPIRMQAVKYGGIAAAVVIGAAGALALVQSRTENGVNTSETFAAPDTLTGSAETYGADGGAFIYDPIADGESAFDVTAADESASDESPSEELFIAESFALGSEEEAQNEVSDGSADAGAGDESGIGASQIAAVTDTTTAAAAKSTSEELFVNDADGAVNIASLEDAEESADYDEMYTESEDDADSYGIMSDNAGSGVSTDNMEWANPATGAGTDWDTEPTDAKFCLIPLELQVKADGAVKYTEDGYVVGDKWKEYVSACFVQFGEITAVDKGLNVYTFIDYFGIPDDEVRAALTSVRSLSSRYTDEEVDILLSDDKAAIAGTFVSKWAIVKGEKLYSPYWLDTHSFDEWRTAGITKDDILRKYDSLIDLPIYLTEEEQRTAYKERIDGFLHDAADTGGVMGYGAAEAVTEARADNSLALSGSRVFMTNDVSGLNSADKEGVFMTKDASVQFMTLLDGLLDDADAVPTPYAAIDESKYESMAEITLGAAYSRNGLTSDVILVYFEKGRTGALVTNTSPYPYMRMYIDAKGAQKLFRITADGSSYDIQ